LEHLMLLSITFNTTAVPPNSAPPDDLSHHLLHILKRFPNFIHVALDAFCQLVVQFPSMLHTIWATYSQFVSFVFTNKCITGQVDELHATLLTDASNPLEQTGDAVNERLLRENQSMQTFFTKSSFVRQLTQVALSFSQSPQLIPQSLELLKHLIHLLPTLDIYSNESNVSMFCLKPTEQIIDLFFLLTHSLQRFDPDSIVQPSSSDCIVSNLISHLFSLLLELDHTRTPTSQDHGAMQSPRIACLHLISRMVLFAPQHAIRFLPVTCLKLIQCETRDELFLMFSIFRDSIYYLQECTADVGQNWDGEGKEHIASVYNCSELDVRFSLHMCAVSALHVMSHQDGTLESEGRHLLTHIERLLNQRFVCTFTTTRNNTLPQDNTLFSELCTRRNLKALSQGFQHFVHEHFTLLFEPHPFAKPRASLYKWIRGTKHRMQNMPTQTLTEHGFSSVEYFLLIIGTIFHNTRCEHNYVNRRPQLQLMRLCSSLDPLTAGLIFQPLLTFELAHEEHPQGKLEILYTIPTLGTQHEICVRASMRLINSLANHSEYLPVALRMMLILWKENDKIFSTLKNALLQSSSKYGTGNVRAFSFTTRLAIADTVLRVCEFHPVRGLKLISVLSQVLCQETDAHILAVALGAMKILCDDELLDFFTAWFRVVSDNVLRHVSISEELQVAVCQLFSCANKEYYIDEDDEHVERKGYYDEDLDFESDYRTEVRHIVQSLLDWATNGSEQVREASLHSLAQFSLPALLFATSVEPDDDTVTATDSTLQSSSTNQREMAEDLLEKRKNGIMNLSHVLLGIIREEKNPSVLEAVQPLLARIMKTELQKPIQSGTLHTQQVSRRQIPAHHLLKNFLDFVCSQKQKPRNILIDNRLWCAAERVPKRKKLEFFDSELQSLLLNVSMHEDSILGVPSRNLQFQGFISFVSNYYAVTVNVMENRQQKQLKNSQRPDSRLVHTIAFDHIVGKIRAYVDHASIAVSANALMCLGALCMILPSHSHQNVEHVCRIIEEKLNTVENFIHSDWWLYAANCALVAASFEIHVEADLNALFDRFQHTVTEATDVLCNGVNDTECLDANVMSGALALGLLTKNLCVSSSVMDGDTDGIPQQPNTEKARLQHVITSLFSLCFPHQPAPTFKDDKSGLQRPLSFLEARFPSESTDCDDLFFANRMNTRQMTCIMLGLAHCCDALVRCGETRALMHIYRCLWETLQQLCTDLKNKSLLFGEDKSQIISRCKIYLSILCSFPIVAEQVYKSGKSRLHESEWIHTLRCVEAETQRESTSMFQKLHIFSNSCMGTLIFSLMRNGFEFKSSQDMTTYLHEIGVRAESVPNATHRIASIMLLGGLLGCDWNTPIPRSRMDDSDDTLSLSLESLLDNMDDGLEKSTFSLKRMLMNNFHDAKHRIFTGLVLGALSELYVPRNSHHYMDSVGMKEGNAYVPLQSLDSNGLSTFFVGVLEEFSGEANSRTDIARLDLGLSLLVSAEYLPQLRYGDILNNIMLKLCSQTASTAQSEAHFTNTLVFCLHLLCKDAQSASGKSSSLRTLSDICEKAQMSKMSMGMFSAVIRVIPHLILAFPTNRALGFLEDCCNLVFFSSSTQRHIEWKITYLSALRDCMTHKLPNEVFRLLQQQLEGIKQSLPSCLILHQTSAHVDTSTLLILKEWALAAAVSPFQSQIFSPRSSVTFNECVIRACATYEDATHSIAAQVLSPLRDFCCSPIASRQECVLVASMIADSMSHMDHSNKLKWIESSLNVVSFHMSKDVSSSARECALIVLSHMLSSWKHTQCYLLHGSQESGIIDALATNDTVRMLTEIEASSRIRVEVQEVNAQYHALYLLGELVRDKSIGRSSVRSLLERIFGQSQNGEALRTLTVPLGVHLRSEEMIRDIFRSTVLQQYAELVRREGEK